MCGRVIVQQRFFIEFLFTVEQFTVLVCKMALKWTQNVNRILNIEYKRSDNLLVWQGVLYGQEVNQS